MPNLFAVLSRDHEDVKRTLTELDKGPTKATGADENQLALRKRLTEELIIEESKHEAVEEMYFWPVVRERVPGGNRIADEAIGQEDAAKQVLHKLDKTDADDPEFETLLSQFIAAGREHIAFEETQVWPKLRPLLSEKEAEDLGKEYETAKKAAPTRPHPGMRSSPGALRTTGPVVAAADRARDAVTGRGKD